MKEKLAVIVSGTAAAVLALLFSAPVPGGGRQTNVSAKENGMVRSTREAGVPDMKPVIDRTPPARIETATFALG